MAREVNQPSTLRSVDSVRAERQQRLSDRYGGFDWVATFLGFAVANFFFSIIFLAIVGAIVGRERRGFPPQHAREKHGRTAQ